MKHVSRQNAIDALREFRIAHRMIAGIHGRFGKRWTDSIGSGLHSDIEFSEDEIQEYKVARDHLLKSLSFNMYFPDTHWMLANAYEEIDRDTGRMLQYYNSCLDLDPCFDDVIVARMGVLLSQKNFAGAEQDLLCLEELGSVHAEPMREHYDKMKNAG